VHWESEYPETLSLALMGFTGAFVSKARGFSEVGYSVPNMSRSAGNQPKA
jgi:hypothetical protein